MDLLIIGAGYVGLTISACFAEMGHQVTCVDINQEKIQMLRQGEIPFHEPGLREIVTRNQQSGRLLFTTDINTGLKHSIICFIAVDTPSKPDGSANLDAVLNVSESIGNSMTSYHVIVNKSTSPVGTTNKIQATLQQCLEKRKISVPFDVVSNPEFLKEGNAIDDFMKPDRIIIGTKSPKARKLMEQVYAPFMHNHDRLIVMDPASSEMTKYAANAMLATRISFMNELASLCEVVGADISLVRKGIGSDHRIGYHFLYAGAGFGGSCFPKDLKSLRFQAKENNTSSRILDAVHEVNENQKSSLFTKIQNYYQITDGISGKTFGILGLSFKPNTDDMREAPSLNLIKSLLQNQAFVRLYDPIAMENAKKIFPDHPNIVWCEDEQQAANHADALVLMTEWKQFRFLNFPKLLSLMTGNAFFDGRNQYVPIDMFNYGFDYISIGRKAMTHQQTAKEVYSEILE